jgi:hypothetical protein
LPPQPAKRAKPRTSCSSAQLLLATTAGQEKRDGAASLHNGEADDAIGLLERCWSAAPWLASPEKHDHSEGNPKAQIWLSSGIEPIQKPTTTVAGTAPPPLSAGIAGESDNGLDRLTRALFRLL